MLTAPFQAFAASDTDEMVYRASLGRADDIKLLLTKGVSADTKNNEGVPVLLLASARKDLEGLNVVQALVEGGANINARDSAGQTALFYAASQGNIPIVKYLLSKDIDMSAIDGNGNQARNVAYLSGHKDAADAMDAFVQERNEQYQQQQKATEEQNKANQERAALEKQLADEKEKARLAALANVKPPESPADPAALAERNKQLADMRNDLAFDACAFEYWSFCQQLKKSTEYSAEDLAKTISEYQVIVDALTQLLHTDYNIPVSAISGLMTGAQTNIHKQIADMPSNIERTERGIGKAKDMQVRCEEVAKQFANYELQPAPVQRVQAPQPPQRRGPPPRRLQQRPRPR